MDTINQSATRPRVFLGILFALGASHLLNDTIQSLIPAVYPILQRDFALDLAQIGIITLTFQLAGSLLQPLVGLYTDRHPLPYSTVIGLAFSLGGVVWLAYAHSYGQILFAVTLIGIGSSVFHPEATRSARHASGGRQGLAQGIFQVGGQLGGALGPLLAALIIVPRGQASLSWFAAMALLAMVLMGWTARHHATIRSHFMTAHTTGSGGHPDRSPYPREIVARGLVVLSVLMFSKLAYLESFRSFYTFYLIDRFDVSIPQSQMMLFVFFIASAVGVLLGGIVGDRIGRYRIIWISILGPLPFTLLLPYADLFWTGALTVLINLVMASAFASIMIYAMDLVPHRIGLIGGLFYGLNFGLSGIAAALLGIWADSVGIETVYVMCSFLPLVGLLTFLLPRLEARR
ncbi:MFS transporter [Aureimonas ureilytica]|uniref:MFS transporter n=1 Tax=Aureimonas ureilytica TaxID=401562 RepID=UPI00036DBE37|nr:MFS transporter [Aureimonas ureilytica]